MKIVFISTLLTPHQIPFCNYMSRLAQSFCFIQMNDAGDSWTSKGQRIFRKDYPYLLSYNEETQLCQEKLLEADLVIAGGVELKLLKKRMEKGKPVFVYLERFYKNGITAKNFLKAACGTFIHHGIYQRYRPYLLCAGGYCAGDAAIFGNYRKRTLKWGYFPESRELCIDTPLKKESNTILWAGRLIDWKHPDDMLIAAKKLKDLGCRFQLKILGEGDMQEILQKMILQYDLSDCVQLCGGLPGEQVRQEMDRAGIFVSTSDYGEGWGAVLNEAMSSGCAVISSHAVGAAPFLIKDGENGFVYESGNIDELVSLCAKLLEDQALCQEIGRCAYDTLANHWSAEEAAKRLIRTAEKVISGQKDVFEESGICSYAEPWKQNQVYGMIKNGSNNKKGTGGNTAFPQ